MFIPILLTTIIGGIIGLIKGYKNNKFFGFIKGISIGSFIGLIIVIITLIIKILVKYE